MAKDPFDPKGLIRDSFSIDNITEAECRSIFLDWALSIESELSFEEVIARLLSRHKDKPTDHPMHKVLSAGLQKPPKPVRRGRRHTHGTSDTTSE